MLKFPEWPKKSGDHFSKTWLSLKEISYLQVIFVLVWMKQTLISFNLHRDETGNRFSNIKNTFTESLQLQMSVLHQRCASSVWSLKLIHGWAKYIYIKKKYLMCHIPFKMLKKNAIPDSSLWRLQIHSSKGWRKTR